MNVPNKLTISRIGLTFVMVVFLTFPSIPFGKTLALLTFGLAALTDWYDGILARRLNRVSVFGQLMDPLADKILVCAAFVSFAAIDRPPPYDPNLPIVPAWIVITIISREFLITGLRLLAMQQGRVVPASKWGKHKMIWQTVTISVIMLGLAFQENVLPLVFKVPNHPVVLSFNTWFMDTVIFLSSLVGSLSVVSGAVYFWESRAVYLDDV